MTARQKREEKKRLSRLRQLLITISSKLKPTVWFASVVLDAVLEPQRLAHLAMSLFLCSSSSNLQGESRALEGRRVSTKSPSSVQGGDEGVADNFLPNWLPNTELLETPLDSRHIVCGTMYIVYC